MPMPGFEHSGSDLWSSTLPLDHGSAPPHVLPEKGITPMGKYFETVTSPKGEDTNPAIQRKHVVENIMSERTIVTLLVITI